MRGAVVAASLAFLLSAVPVFAQTAGQPRPVAPAGQPPIQRPPAQTVPPPAAQPPAPFPEGAKIAFVNLQQVASQSADGKAANAKVQALIQKKQTEGTEKTKALQANQQKLQQSGSLMNEQARSQLEKEIDRQQREGERFQQDAQAEVNELQQELQNEFQKKLFPILEQLSKEKGLQILFSAADAGVIWAEPGLDLTSDAIKKLDASAAKPATPPKE